MEPRLMPKCIQNGREESKDAKTIQKGGLVAIRALVGFWTSKKRPPRILWGRPFGDLFFPKSKKGVQGCPMGAKRLE